MPTLKLATLCEKVIVDANGVPSLISLFSQFNVSVPTGEAVPENAVAPKEWAMFCLWDCSPEEAGREFSQIFEITMPNGNLFGEPRTIRFTPQHDKLRQNVIADAPAVPIGRTGQITVTTRVEVDGRVVVAPISESFVVAYVQAAS